MNFCFLLKNMVKIIGRTISEQLRGKYSHKFLDPTKQSVTNAFKTPSRRTIQKAAEATGDLIDNKVPHKITKVSKNSQ